ncbi:MAG: type II toxin-antitoxin system mRNA interferase toxin, RelE/StbE family [Calothrix sp. MO_192.B10]|nr:type II toxin-antitoxin system mRNA interferase toxin, RelE/StbE family [Calothrix sp. MO_192.B10]
MSLVWDNSFKRAFKRLIKKNPQLQDRVFEVLEQLADNPFTPSLKSHKLTGQLEGLWSCSVTYDCRIIYTFKEDEALEDNLIVLIDIGTHDEVY